MDPEPLVQQLKKKNVGALGTRMSKCIPFAIETFLRYADENTTLQI